MLDYSEIVEFKNHKYGDFICYYIIIDNEIVLYNNDVEFARIPYTDDNEKDVLDIMKKQIKAMRLAKNIFENNLYSQDTKTKYYTILSLLFIVLSINYLLKKNYITGLITSITIILNSLIAIFNTLKLKKYENILDDLEKNELFLEFETEINRFIKDINDLDDFHEFEKLNINDIHFLDYEDVDNLVETAKDYQNKVK